MNFRNTKFLVDIKILGFIKNPFYFQEELSFKIISTFLRVIIFFPMKKYYSLE